MSWDDTWGANLESRLAELCTSITIGSETGDYILCQRGSPDAHKPDVAEMKKFAAMIKSDAPHGMPMTVGGVKVMFKGPVSLDGAGLAYMTTVLDTSDNKFKGAYTVALTDKQKTLLVCGAMGPGLNAQNVGGVSNSVANGLAKYL